MAELTRSIRDAQRRTVAAILGTGLLIVAAVLYGLEAGGPRVLVGAGVVVDRRGRRVVGAAGGVAAASLAAPGGWLASCRDRRSARMADSSDVPDLKHA